MMADNGIFAVRGCHGPEETLFNCSHTPLEPLYCGKDIAVSCSLDPFCEEGSVRLTGGASNIAGRLEVCEYGRWGSVCSHASDDKDALVACKQLGFYAVDAFAERGQIVPNNIPINIFASHCHGDEANLTSCEHEVSTQRCNHSLDVVLTCRGLLIYISLLFVSLKILSFILIVYTTCLTMPTPSTKSKECNTSEEDMCSSLNSLRNQILSSPSTAGSCNVSDNCTRLSRSLTVSYSVFRIPLSLSITLCPCSVPYKVHLEVSSPLLGQVTNDDFMESRTITIRVFGFSTNVIVSLTQQCYGVTIASRLIIGGSRVDFIPPTDIYMFCDRSSSITMATSSVSSLPVTTTLIPTPTTPSTMPAPSPTTCPVACGPECIETPSVTYDAVNQSLNIVHYPPEGSVCKCVFRKMEKKKQKKTCFPRDTMSGIRLRKNEIGRLVITCKTDGCSYKQSIQVRNE